MTAKLTTTSELRKKIQMLTFDLSPRKGLSLYFLYNGMPYPPVILHPLECCKAMQAVGFITDHFIDLEDGLIVKYEFCADDIDIDGEHIQRTGVMHEKWYDFAASYDISQYAAILLAVHVVRTTELATAVNNIVNSKKQRYATA